MNHTSFRLILDKPRRATLHMAIDEYFLDQLIAGKSGPLLRIYRWSQPSVTIGYFQNAENIQKKFLRQHPDVPVVRRITGGGLVWHGQDTTLALLMPLSSPLLPSDVKSSYLKINEILISEFRKKFAQIDFADCRVVPPARSDREKVCFESPSCYDLMLGGKKVGGASQRRKNGILLHQSSLMLDLGHEELSARIVDAFKAKWGIRFELLDLTSYEVQDAEALEAIRFSSDEWARPPVLG